MTTSTSPARTSRAADPARALLALVIIGCAVAAAVIGPRAPGGIDPVTVMTRNLYLGGDITRPVRAVQGLGGRDALIALGHATHELRTVVDRTDFRVRSGLLADEITATRPDLVGLQEVALWRHGPLQLDQLGKPNATEVDVDFLELLRTQLAARGVPYEVAAVQSESDVEAPAFTGDPFAGTARQTRDVRLTIRDVVLARQSSGIHVLDSGGRSYAQHTELDLAGLPFSFVRGYAWVEVAAGPLRFRFVTTHLESQSSAVALTQAQELVSGLVARTDQTTVVVCDCNSDPESSQPSAGESVAPDAAYRAITGAGFRDQWIQSGAAAGPGFTSGFSESVDDPDASALRRRLDLVLVRAANGDQVVAGGGQVTGTLLDDRDPATGLWPSDHAGVVLRLQLRSR